jgi:hypothetical protein
VTRHAHSTGHHVERRFGWDTHGLPVEHEIDQKLNIKGKEDVLKMGIEAYNNECRAIVRLTRLPSCLHAFRVKRHTREVSGALTRITARWPPGHALRRRVEVDGRAHGPVDRF